MFWRQKRREFLLLICAAHGAAAFFLVSDAKSSIVLVNRETDIADVSANTDGYTNTKRQKPAVAATGPIHQDEMARCSQDSSFLLVFVAGAAAGVIGTIVLQVMLRNYQKLMSPMGGDGRDGTAVIAAGTHESKLQTDDEVNLESFWSRCLCLCFLMAVQSVSSLILARFHEIVSKYTSLVYFFTMLVGLGGNAGVQSTVLAVRQFARKQPVSIFEQASVGIRLALVLAPLAFLRCMLQNTETSIAAVVGIAAALLTVLATVLGTSLAVILHKSELDPAHASPAIQVLMDMIGLTITCSVATAFVSMNWLSLSAYEP